MILGFPVAKLIEHVVQKDSVSATTAATSAFAGSSAPRLDWTITADARGLTAYNLAVFRGAFGQIASRSGEKRE